MCVCVCGPSDGYIIVVHYTASVVHHSAKEVHYRPWGLCHSYMRCDLVSSKLPKF